MSSLLLALLAKFNLLRFFSLYRHRDLHMKLLKVNINAFRDGQSILLLHRRLRLASDIYAIPLDSPLFFASIRSVQFSDPHPRGVVMQCVRSVQYC